MDLSPETNVRLSAGRLLGVTWALIVFVAGAVATAVWSYSKALTKLDEHVSNQDVHLDPAYMRDHGRPIGRWDLEVERAETSKRLDGINDELKALRALEARRR